MQVKRDGLHVVQYLELVAERELRVNALDSTHALIQLMLGALWLTRYLPESIDQTLVELESLGALLAVKEADQ